MESVEKEKWLPCKVKKKRFSETPPDPRPYAFPAILRGSELSVLNSESPRQLAPGPGERSPCIDRLQLIQRIPINLTTSTR